MRSINDIQTGRIRVICLEAYLRRGKVHFLIEGRDMTGDDAYKLIQLFLPNVPNEAVTVFTTNVGAKSATVAHNMNVGCAVSERDKILDIAVVAFRESPDHYEQSIIDKLGSKGIPVVQIEG